MLRAPARAPVKHFESVLAATQSLQLCWFCPGAPLLRKSNFTEPDSHFLKGAGGCLQGFNYQAAFDSDHQVIVPLGDSSQISDAVHLLPMLKRIQANYSMELDSNTRSYIIADIFACS